jgi:hypothetical protein
VATTRVFSAGSSVWRMRTLPSSPFTATAASSIVTSGLRIFSRCKLAMCCSTSEARSGWA